MGNFMQPNYDSYLNADDEPGIDDQILIYFIWVMWIIQGIIQVVIL